MKLVFYGGGDAEDNLELDQLCLSLAKKKSPKITFIPSSSYDGEYDYFEFVNQFRKKGIDQFLYFPIDIPFDLIFLREVLSSDIIHIGGGNTFYLLKYLRSSGMIMELKKFVKAGGILSGLSAGAIVMSPNIQTASYPSFDHDENDEGIKNLKSMNLANFEFFPHYKNSKRYDKELLEQSLKTHFPIIASPDGHGVIVDDHSLVFHKRNFIFHRGNKTIIKI